MTRTVIRAAAAVAGLAAGITLAAGPAPAALAGPQPFSLSVSPGRLAAGTAGAVRHLSVANNGTRPVTIRAELSQLSRDSAGNCGVARLGTLAWATIRPSSFTLQPGGRQAATLTIGGHVPGGVHDLVAAFVAVPAPGSGVSVSGAVGAQMQVRGTGAPQATRPCTAVAAPSATPSPAAATPAAARGFPWAYTALAAALLAVIAALVVVIVRQRRRLRRGPPPAGP